MSKSIHITIKNFSGLTKAQLDEQFVDPKSDLAQWNRKSYVKKEIKSKKELPKNLLWPTISLFMFDYIVTLILTPIAIPILNNPLFDIIQASLNK